MTTQAKNYLPLLFITSIAIVMASFVIVGCETESASAQARIRITPDTAAIKVGESIVLTASGGYEYHWSISNDTWGILSTREGERVTYKSLATPSTNAVQLITVTSVIENSPGDATNTSSYARTGNAYITHK